MKITTVFIFLIALSSCKNMNHISQSKGIQDMNHYICYKKMNVSGLESIDYNQAFYWCSRSALAGNRNAKVLLAEVYLMADEKLRDYDKALFWLNEAAKQEHAHAYYLLYLMHYKGIGTQKSKQKGLFWLQKAIAEKHPLTKTLLSVNRP